MEWNYVDDQPLLSSGEQPVGGCVWTKIADLMAKCMVLLDFDSTVFVGGNRFKGEHPEPMRENINGIAAFVKSVNAQVIIVTNQGWSNVAQDSIKLRLERGASLLVAAGIPVVGIYYSRGPDIYKKPLPGMAALALGDYVPEKMYMIGDAAGRSGDFSDSDLKFARNIGAEFLTPELILGKETVPYSAVSNWSGCVEDLGGKPCIRCDGKIQEIQPCFAREILLLCGAQGSGKTSLATALERSGYSRVSGDEIRGKYPTALARTIASGAARIVCDRTNYSVAQRAEIIEIAKRSSYSVRVIRLVEPVELSQHKMMCRALMGGTFISKRWYKKIVDVTAEEAKMIDSYTEGAPIIDSSVASEEFMNFFALETD